MPNNIINTVTITGSKSDLNSIRELMHGEENFDFEKILPMPKELLTITTGSNTIDNVKVHAWREVEGKCTTISKEEFDELKSKYGSYDWYDWAIKNWGTKWGAYEHRDVIQTGKTLKYRFETAWSIANGVYTKLSLMFPDVKISVRATGEVDTPWTSMFKNGIKVNS